MSTKYVPQYQLEEQYKKQAEQLVERSTTLAKSEIAIKFLNKGVDIELISEATGLSVEEIRSLERGE
jgi:hypothetical protein